MVFQIDYSQRDFLHYNRHSVVCSDATEFKDILMTNVVGPFLVIQALLPLIRKGAKKQVEECNLPSDLSFMDSLQSIGPGHGVFTTNCKK